LIIFCRGPQRLSQDFSGKTFLFVNKTQFEADLQTQAAEVGCKALEKTWIIRTEFLLFLVADFKVPLRRKFVGLFWPNSVAEYRVVSIFTQKTEQETVHPIII